MLTKAASRSLQASSNREVLPRSMLYGLGFTESQVRANVAAGRWRIFGQAVVLHNGSLTRRQQWDVALITAGPRSMLTAFTAAEYLGLKSWERDHVDVLAPAGNSRPSLIPGIELRLHRTRHWTGPAAPGVFRCQELGPALAIATRSFATPRPACGLMAAAVQQRLITADKLLAALDSPTVVRHRRQLRAAVLDIGGGSHALSEIDFIAICRRNGLPQPVRQALRPEPSGARRYLDASWERPDGRLVVVEVDGALHLNVNQWWNDQNRQNELVLTDALILRFPSVVIRTDEAAIVSQLRRALQIA